jgi:hypothetical protein
MSFLEFWYVALAVLLLLAGLAGRASGKGWLGILIDGRGRYSLNHLQIVLWTVLVLSTMLALFFYSRPPIAASLAIPKTLLLLMGISVGSAATAGAIKSGKDVRGGAVQAKGFLPDVAITDGKSFLPPRPAQVVLQEEGPQIDQVVDVTKFQNLIFTAVIAATYVTLLIDRANAGSPGYPNLDQVPNLLWLLGVSHAGYLAGKMPDQPTVPGGGGGGALRRALAAATPLPAAAAIAAAPAVAAPVVVAVKGAAPPNPAVAVAAVPVVAAVNAAVPAPPTWSNRISGLFNAVDVNHMLRDPGQTGNPLDLGTYQSVKANGGRIYAYVVDGRMPVPPSLPWTQSMKDDFKAWMDAGYPQ